MTRFTLPFTAASFGLVALALAPAAQAHIKLLEPTARYDVVGEMGIKSCPCGLGSSNRTCNVSVDGSDPDRSTRVTRAEAGSTITLRFQEFVGHDGTFRVAFDPEGADVADFNSNIIVPMVPDPPGNTGNVGQGDIWEIPVTLPDMICDNCTLQLIQAMNGDMLNPVIDPSSTGSYYVCVDLELVAPGTLGEVDPMTDPGDDMENDDGSMVDDPTMTGAPGSGQGQGGTMGVAVQPTDNPGMVGGMMTGATQGNTANNTPVPGGVSNMNGTGTMPDMFRAPGVSMGGNAGSSGGCSMGSGSVANSGAALAFAALLSLLGVRRRTARSRV